MVEIAVFGVSGEASLAHGEGLPYAKYSEVFGVAPAVTIRLNCSALLTFSVIYKTEGMIFPIYTVRVNIPTSTFPEVLFAKAKSTSKVAATEFDPFAVTEGVEV